jgi:hypothetical protein
MSKTRNKTNTAWGASRAPKNAARVSTDPDVLNRRSKEFGAMDSMFAIGAMSDWIPADYPTGKLAWPNPY